MLQLYNLDSRKEDKQRFCSNVTYIT